MATAYILAKTLKEAHDFAAKDLALPRGSYRPVNTPSTLTSVRNADLYLLPGWDSRFDRFAMRGALKWTKMNVIDVAARQAEEAEARAVVEPGKAEGALPSDAEFSRQYILDETPQEEAQAFFDGVNAAYDALPAAPAGEEATEPAPSTEPAAPKLAAVPDLNPAIYGPPIDRSNFPMSPEMVITNPPETEKKKRIRRKRCPKCTELILPTEFDEHVTNCETEEA